MRRLLVLGTGIVFAVVLIGRGDLAAAMALWTDDAVIDNPVTCPEAPCTGKAGVQREMERRISSKNQPKTLKHYVSGNLLTTRAEFKSALTEKAGVERIILWLTYETKGDKIAWERGPVFERSDAQTLKYVTWLKTQAPAR